MSSRRDAWHHHRGRRGARPRPGQLTAQPPHGHPPRRAGDRRGERGRAGDRAVRRRATARARVRRPARRQRRQRRGAPAREAHVPAQAQEGVGREARLRRQGDHVRLGWHQPEAERPEPRLDEDGHVRRRGGAVGALGAAGAGMRQRGDRLPDVHRQHAVGLGDEARRRAAHPRWQDRRDPQHRRRGPSRARRRAVARRRGAARRHRRHRHAHRGVHGGARPRLRRRARQRPGARRPGGRLVDGRRREDVAAAARTAATASCSTPTSPTSRTSAGRTGVRSPRPSSSPSSSATRRGRTSTWPAR